ncbi:hypothetical protein Droror1_Dr00014179 [Drosera rotundifolia]
MEAAPLYETLSPLAASTTTTASPSPSAVSPEPYSVYRNEISLSTIDSGSDGAAAAVDYFSLDLDEEIKNEIDKENPVVENAVFDDGVGRDETKLESGWFRAECRFKSPMLQLHKEILDFCEFLSPTLEEQALRTAAIDSVFDVIEYIWPNCTAEVFGSFKTGLYLPSSDIDVVILGSNIKKPQLGLQALSRALSQRGIAKQIQVIGKARVPIIKFVEKTSGVSFDVSFDADNGPKAAEYIKDAIVRIPPLRPLCLILKVFLQQRELNEVYSGGIGSYALLSMLIAMLRSLNESKPCPEHNLGILLVKFFELYALRLNTTDVGVSCNGRGTFFLKSSRGFGIKGKPCILSIEDPQGPDNDIGKSSFNYFQVRSAFRTAYSTLTNTKTIMSLGPGRSILGTIIRPDPVLVERKGGAEGEVTFSALLPGAGEPVESKFDDNLDLLYNWDSPNHHEEPLPRGGRGGAMENGNPSSSSRQKRKKDSKSREPKENFEKSSKKVRQFVAYVR